MSSERDSVDEFLALAGRGVEREADVLAGDEQRVERIERAAQKRYGPRPKARSRWLVASAVGGLFAAGVAFAAWRASGTHDGPKPALTAVPVKSPAPVPVAAPSAVPNVVAVASSPTSTSSAQPRSGALPRAAARPSAQPTPEPAPDVDQNATAATLFAAANRARVSGDVPLAIVLSQELVSQFPRSAEAVSTHLTLGMLRLQRGEAERALSEFQAYEAQGSSSAEALWGKAQALQKLGRAAEERAVLTELLQKYPRAAYTAAAHKRLGDLP